MRQSLKYYFSKNLLEYIKVFMIFIIGIIISIIVINNSNDYQKQELKNYIDNKILTVKNNNYTNQNEIFLSDLKQKIKVFLLLVFLSSTVLGIPFAYLVIGKKGFSIGYTLAAISATQDTKTAIIFICNSMLFHNIIYLISMSVILVAGVNFSKGMIHNEKRKIKFEIFRYSIFLIIAFLFIALSAFVEAYISNNFLYLLKKYL